MIDRGRRDMLAARIHEFIIGQFTNSVFEELLSEDRLSIFMKQKPGQDRILRPMVERAWCLYSDHEEYKLTGEHKLARVRRREVLRWILFLRSDREYEWPDFRFINRYLHARGCLMSLLTLGRWGRREFERFRRAGDLDVWPFIRRSDFVKTCKTSCPFPLIVRV